MAATKKKPARSRLTPDPHRVQLALAADATGHATARIVGALDTLTATLDRLAAAIERVADEAPDRDWYDRVLDALTAIAEADPVPRTIA